MSASDVPDRHAAGRGLGPLGGGAGGAAGRGLGPLGRGAGGGPDVAAGRGLGLFLAANGPAAAGRGFGFVFGQAGRGNVGPVGGQAGRGNVGPGGPEQAGRGLGTLGAGRGAGGGGLPLLRFNSENTVWGPAAVRDEWCGPDETRKWFQDPKPKPNVSNYPSLDPGSVCSQLSLIVRCLAQRSQPGTLIVANRNPPYPEQHTDGPDKPDIEHVEDVYWYIYAQHIPREWKILVLKRFLNHEETHSDVSFIFDTAYQSWLRMFRGANSP